jgi:glycerophosphoryl diester phosphodiesterase
MPSSPSRADRLAALVAKPFAHRGLHGRDGLIENTRGAFEAAIAAGSGIELDTQVSADGDAAVIHDYALDRLAGLPGRVCGLAMRELERIRIGRTGETIPSLEQVLALIAGRAPLLIEVKSPGRHVAPLCEAVDRALRSYIGPVAVMSFNPEIGRWFRSHAPDVLRGLVVTEEGKKGFRGRIERHLSLRVAKPDFLAYDVRDFPSRFASGCRASGMPVLTWTVRTEADRARAAANADQIIYELPA